MTPTNFNAGWIKDTPDNRDIPFKSVIMEHRYQLPAVVDLRSAFGDCYDQGSLGSCTAQATIGAFDFLKRKRNIKQKYAALYLYYNTRIIEKTVNEDSGASIRNAMKAANKNGIAKEVFWPYVEANFKKKPSLAAYRDGDKNQTLKYFRIPQTENDIKACLADGYPIVFGLYLVNQFMSDEAARTAKIKLPNPEEHSIGGHAMLIVGYRESDKMFIVRNSWANDWGDRGYCYIPFNYVLDPEWADDFWTIRVVE